MVRKWVPQGQHRRANSSYLPKPFGISPGVHILIVLNNIKVSIASQCNISGFIESGGGSWAINT